MKRAFDLFFSTSGIILLSPVMLLLWLLIRLESGAPSLFRQQRVGRDNIDFTLYKFRTMVVNAEQSGSLTVGGRDSRITRVGFFLRKLKLDELPQLFNVLMGDMSLVGPRPELRKYVDMYTAEEKEVLSIRPGITDYASLKYFHENEILGQSAQPEKEYIHRIMPEKLRLNLEYVRNNTLLTDFTIIVKTLFRIIRIH